jgi:hypothetical protein
VANLLFILIQYWLAKAAGIPAIVFRSREMALPEIEQNFFNSDYHAKRSLKALRVAIERIFGSKQSIIFLRSSAFLFFAAIACLVTLQFVYVGADTLFTFLKNGLAIELQPDEYDRFRSAAGNAFDRLLTPDHFFHAGYFVSVTAGLFIFAYAVFSACSAVVFVGLYRFVVWFSQEKPLTSWQILFRLFRLLPLILIADAIFLLLSFGAPLLLGRVIGIEPFQRSDVQKFELTDGPHDMLIYSVGIFRNQFDDKPYIQYQFRLGVGPIAPSDIAVTPGTPRPVLDQLLGSGGHYPLSTDKFCVDAGLTNRLECGRRLTDEAFVRIRNMPTDVWLGFARQVFEHVGKAVCLETDVGQRDIWGRDTSPSVRLAFAAFVPFLVTILLVWWLGALLVPILGCLYILNRIVVRIGRWQIVRSETGLNLMTKHGWALLALPVVLLLVLLQLVRKTYCGG